MEGSARRILVIKLGALGDFIQALGPMAAIRAYHAKDHITLLTTAPFAPLAAQSGYIDDIWIDTRPKWYDLRGWLALRHKLNAGQFTRVYDLQNNDRTALYLRLFSPRPEWVGAARGASHRNASKERTAGKAFHGHVQTLGLAGIKNVRADTLDWVAGRSDFEGLRAPYILIVPGASPKHAHKRWPPEFYAGLCTRLLAQNYLPVLIGGPADSTVIDAIYAQVPQCLSLAGKTDLQDMPALARGAAGAIGNDTGPMHLIAPTGCPSIVLFSGATSPQRHAPFGRSVVTLQKDNLTDLQVEEVWRAFSLQHSTP